MKITLSLILLSALAFSGDYTNSIGMKFKDIPAGSFTMGTLPLNCPADDHSTDAHKYCLESEAPSKNIKIRSFYLGETEVTQGQWDYIMGYNPSYHRLGDEKMPVETISWDEVKVFISKLNEREKTNKYRLPTEEEWEYAARAGTTTRWYCGDDESCVSSIAVYDANRPMAVKSKEPNNWGLYDMSGNVTELTETYWSYKYNPKDKVHMRTARGGGYGGIANRTRSAYPIHIGQISHNSDVGFRVLMDK